MIAYLSVGRAGPSKASGSAESFWKLQLGYIMVVSEICTKYSKKNVSSFCWIRSELMILWQEYIFFYNLFTYVHIYYAVSKVRSVKSSQITQSHVYGKINCIMSVLGALNTNSMGFVGHLKLIWCPNEINDDVLIHTFVTLSPKQTHAVNDAVSFDQ